MKNIYDLIVLMSERISENKDFLTDLDMAIGDADHGINMDRGFKAAVEALDSSNTDVNVALKKSGMTLLSKVGGASGPLYGSALMSAAKITAEKEDLNSITQRLQAAVDAVMNRGKAVKGEKTMLDAMIPALDSLKLSVQEGEDLKAALTRACEKAHEGVEWTKTVRATKGRASYLGDRSIGHQDPGATSFTILLEALRDYI